MGITRYTARTLRVHSMFNVHVHVHVHVHADYLSIYLPAPGLGSG